MVHAHLEHESVASAMKPIAVRNETHWSLLLDHGPDIVHVGSASTHGLARELVMVLATNAKEFRDSYR
eukprot:3330866-Lingulodinium_polyedra.AAC.1